MLILTEFDTYFYPTTSFTFKKFGKRVVDDYLKTYF